MASKTITQTLLAKYHHLAAREAKIKAKREELRERLLALLDEGKPVEPGRFQPQVIKSQARVLSRQTVTSALGEAEYEWLREQVDPVDRVSFRVLDSQSNSAGKNTTSISKMTDS